MQVFTSEELQERPAEVERSAMAETTFITVDGRPRLVMMSFEEFDRIRGRRHKVLRGVELPQELLAAMQEIADAHPGDDQDPGLRGGMLDGTSRGVEPG